MRDARCPCGRRHFREAGGSIGTTETKPAPPGFQMGRVVHMGDQVIEWPADPAEWQWRVEDWQRRYAEQVALYARVPHRLEVPPELLDEWTPRS